MNVSARNQIRGKVVGIKKNDLHAVVTFETECGLRMSATITTSALEDMGIQEGGEVMALIKSTQVMLATK